MKTILAVDDEEHILELITYNVENAGYQVIKAVTAEEAMQILTKKDVDLVLLDWMLPGADGMDVLKFIRSSQKLKKLPVIMLTAKSDEISKVVGLEIGADDYLTKPFGVFELVARIKALFRRIDDREEEKKSMDEMASEEEEIKIGTLVINKTRRTVMVRDVKVELSLKEFDLLYLLAKNRGIVFTRDMLLERIWGYDYLGETRTVDVHIRNIRKKIEQDENIEEFIQTVRGVGYKFA